MRDFGKMFKLILYISFIILSTRGNAQKISYGYYHYVRAGFENQVTFSTDFKYDSIRFSMNGVTFRSDSKSVYITPKKSGKDTLHSMAYRRGKLVYSDRFVLDVMKPEVFGIFGADLQKKLKLDYIKSYPGVRFVIRVNNYHWEPVGIISYRFSIIRATEIIYSKIEVSNRFSESVKARLQQLENGDLILISEIIVDEYFAEIADPIPTVYEVEL